MIQPNQINLTGTRQTNNNDPKRVSSKSKYLGKSSVKSGAISGPRDNLRFDLGRYSNEVELADHAKANEDEDINPFEFWDSAMTRYPSLAKVVSNLLPISGTSTSVERILSISRNILHFNRGKISPLFRAIVLKKMSLDN
jgi:hypothetical protein